MTWQLADFAEGDLVQYVPSHVRRDPDGKIQPTGRAPWIDGEGRDARGTDRGFVSSVGRRFVFVRYVSSRSEHGQATRPCDLVKL